MDAREGVCEFSFRDGTWHGEFELDINARLGNGTGSAGTHEASWKLCPNELANIARTLTHEGIYRLSRRLEVMGYHGLQRYERAERCQGFGGEEERVSGGDDVGGQRVAVVKSGGVIVIIGGGIGGILLLAHARTAAAAKEVVRWRGDASVEHQTIHLQLALECEGGREVVPVSKGKRNPPPSRSRLTLAYEGGGEMVATLKGNGKSPLHCLQPAESFLRGGGGMGERRSVATVNIVIASNAKIETHLSND
ncbi:hypothetical protein BDZ97DRAFT_1762497 [Flammula alnicola]|nr:hypothetical protein BDZ97DRAFT_1762497 [Flammula alnicola]